MLSVKCGLLRIGIASLQVVYALMKLLPVQKKYVFITKLSNEPTFDFKLLSEALTKRHPEHRVVMLCRPMDRMYIMHIFVQMYHVATAEVVFLDRSCMVVHVLKHRRSLQVVQLWHALGSMKKFGFAILDTPEGQASQLAKTMRMHEGYTSILISSFSFLDDFKEGFGTDGSNVVEIPLPRVDALVDKGYRGARRHDLERRYPTLAAKKNILYCPTFRKSSNYSTQDKVEELIDLIDFDAYNFIYSPHPVSKETISDPRVKRIPELTSQELLFGADIVITDYSSIMYEAGLLDIPVYLYAYDWEQYRLNRSHNLNLEKEAPVVLCKTAGELIQALNEGCYDLDALHDFVQRNIRVPQKGTCCDAIIDLVDNCR